jgi:hypothetical protein
VVASGALGVLRAARSPSFRLHHPSQPSLSNAFINRPLYTLSTAPLESRETGKRWALVLYDCGVS